jgi:hypothetical protein
MSTHPPAEIPPPTLQQMLQAMPKVEIHCHLLVTVRHATFKELARRAAPLSDAAVDALYARGDKPVGVLRALRELDAALLRTPDDLHRITYEYLQDAAAIDRGATPELFAPARAPPPTQASSACPGRTCAPPSNCCRWTGWTTAAPSCVRPTMPASAPNAASCSPWCPPIPAICARWRPSAGR